MQREVPTWLAVVIILVVLVVVVGAYIIFTRPKPVTEGGQPPVHGPGQHMVPGKPVPQPPQPQQQQPPQPQPPQGQ